jgi:hypothetical protein
VCAQTDSNPESQHGFHITVEVVKRGDYATAFASALQTAQEIYDQLDEAEIVVSATEADRFQGVPNGVYCEGCQGHVFPGVRWPTEANGDTKHDWVERCDICQRFPTDAAAAAHVAEFYKDARAPLASDTGKPFGSDHRTPFVDLIHKSPRRRTRKKTNTP